MSSPLKPLKTYLRIASFFGGFPGVLRDEDDGYYVTVLTRSGWITVWVVNVALGFAILM